MCFQVTSQYAHEDRKLVPSPKVATYDLAPTMAALEVAKSMTEAMASSEYAFVMCNFAPPDMVGHTGVYDKAIQAVEATDQAIGLVYAACKQHGYVLVVTCDHGNAEEMIDEEGRPKTSHTTNPVFCIVAGEESGKVHLKDLKLAHREGGLRDVAPTILKVMGLPIPSEMTGRSLLE